ncbi:DUF4229 domain-containing protein [Corynebacterium otitidis]
MNEHSPAENHTSPDSAPDADAKLGSHACRALLKYGLARLGLFVALAAAVQLIGFAFGITLPIVISALLGLLIAFPLSMLVFTNLRIDATRSLARWREVRRRRKRWVQEELAER